MMMKNLLFIASFLFAYAASAQPFLNIKADCPKVEAGMIEIDAAAENGYSEPIEFLGYNEANSPDDNADLSGSFKIAWSEEGMYIHLTVLDDAYDFGEDDAWAQSTYKYDNIEIFFNTDLDNDAADGTRQAEDKQIRHLVGTTTNTKNLGANVIEGEQWIFDIQDGEYVLETLIPWVAITSAGFTLAEGSEIGFTINIGDSDTPGGNRDIIMMWAGASQSDLQYKNTQYYGYVTLTQAATTTGLNNLNTRMFEVHPNPSTTRLSIKNASSDITVYNATGKLVKNIALVSNDMTVEVSDLKAGIYFFQTAGKSQKVIIK